MISRKISNYSLVKRSDRSGTIISTNVFTADTLLRKAIGLMFTSEIDTQTAVIFPYQSSKTRRIHMCCVPYDLGVIYLTKNTIRKMEVLDSWTGHSSYDAEVVIETHPKILENVSVGDNLYLEANSGETISLQPI